MYLRPLPSAESIRECFEYNAETGVVTWRKRPRHHFKTSRGFNTWNARFAHKIVGTPNRAGYLICNFNWKVSLVHRLIWKMVTGADPVEELDHINGIKNDNRWENLREATRAENLWNARGKSTLKGVTEYKPNRFLARITIHRQNIHLGCFGTAEEAHRAYLEAAAQFQGNFAYHKRLSN